jgi:hypothetical protein
MTNMYAIETTKRVRRARFSRAAWVLGGMAVVGCSNPLAVTDPDIITPGSLTGEVGLQTLRNGALRDFVVGYQGTQQTDAQVMTAGLLTDEWRHNGTFTTRAEVELRKIATDNGTLSGVYLILHQARVSLEDAAATLAEDGTDPASDQRIPEMMALAGYTYLAFASNYCNGVPFSRLTPDELVFGEPETNVQAYDRAIAQFDAAMAHGAATGAIVNLARIGKGRALLGKGDMAGAAGAVSAVPTDFAWFTEHSNNTGEERNTIFEFTKNIGRWGIPDSSEGINGIDFVAADDPRITRHFQAGGAFDTSYPDQWQYDNVNSRSDRMRLATGIEARLIEAENQLATGGNWLTTLNDLRANWTALGLDGILNGDGSRSLAPLTDPGTPDARIDMVFDERAFWLYTQNTRLYDLRRLVRQYGRDRESVYPTGPYFKGGNYDIDIWLPVPEQEQNNPNFVQCMDARGTGA